MNTPNPLTRIEREAEEIAVPLRLAGPTGRQQALGFKKGYVTGSLSEIERAAPVVKALEEALAQHEADKKNLCDKYPQLAKKFEAAVLPWVTNAKQILETYKADV